MAEAESKPEYVFFVTQIGSAGTPERQRSDDVLNGIVRPIAAEFGLTTLRGDGASTPGQVGIQIIQQLVGARLIVADLFDRNANAYYELGIAHTLRIPTIVLVDKVETLAFDAAAERVVTIGDDGTKIGIGEAETAKDKLRAFFQTVLDDAFVAENLVTAAATALQVQYLSDRGDAVAREVAALRESIEALMRRVAPDSTATRATPYREDTWFGMALSHVRPLPRAIFAGCLFTVAGPGDAILTAPSDAHAEKCNRHLPDLIDALGVVSGVNWRVRVEVGLPAPRRAGS